MNHFGAIIMAAKLAGTEEILLFGDINQLSYIERNNAFHLAYSRPDVIANIDKELLCTHRNPMDVAYALNIIYDGIYSSKPIVRSLELKGYSGATIPKDTDSTRILESNLIFSGDLNRVEVTFFGIVVVFSFLLLPLCMVGLLLA